MTWLFVPEPGLASGIACCAYNLCDVAHAHNSAIPPRAVIARQGTGQARVVLRKALLLPNLALFTGRIDTQGLIYPPQNCTIKYNIHLAEPVTKGGSRPVEWLQCVCEATESVLRMGTPSVVWEEPKDSD